MIRTINKMMSSGLPNEAAGIVTIALLVLCTHGSEDLTAVSNGQSPPTDLSHSHSALMSNVSSPSSQNVLSMSTNLGSSSSRVDDTSLGIDSGSLHETTGNSSPTIQETDKAPFTTLEQQREGTTTTVTTPTGPGTENGARTKVGEAEFNLSFTPLNQRPEGTTTFTPPSGPQMENGVHKNVGETEFKLSLDSCSGYPLDIVAISGQKGTVFGPAGRNLRPGNLRKCRWSIETPQEYVFLYMLFVTMRDACGVSYSVVASASLAKFAVTGSKRDKDVHMFSSETNLTQAISESGRLYFYLLVHPNASCMPAFRIEFESFKEDVRKHLSVQHTTPLTGHITQWGYDGERSYLCFTDASYTLALPKDHVVMLSFSRFHMLDYWSNCPQGAGLGLYSLPAAGGEKTLLFRKCGRPESIPPRVFDTSLLLHFDTRSNCPLGATGFKALFSFHPSSRAPRMLEGGGLFNCSTPTYSSFKHHLDCNLEKECRGGEDEGAHCPFSSPSCQGLVSAGGKCFLYVNWGRPISSHGAQRECVSQLNGDLAMMKTESEWEALKKVFQYGKQRRRALFGVRSGDSSFPDVYKYTMKWFDHSIAQTVDVQSQLPLRLSYHRRYEMCGSLLHEGQLRSIFFQRCSSEHNDCFLCQVIVRRSRSAGVVFPAISFPFSAVVRRTGQSLVLCVDGHVTHAFLSCDAESRCRADSHEYLKQCRLPSVVVVVAQGSRDFVTLMFVCDDDATKTLPYTLVCDFRPDCGDASDETFCLHGEACRGFRCDNGQCVEQHQRCDWDRDCLDESDEALCAEFPQADRLFEFPGAARPPPPVRISVGADRRVRQVRLTEDESQRSCLDSQFRCSDEDYYCLPVYLLCNGVRDCPGEEDERDCSVYQCPGFFRCRASRVCVHADHLCDGWPQCPQRDDEWLCHGACPPGCQCQGRAFVCSQPFNVTASSPDLRYLDASGSGMTLRDVTGHVRLVWVSLARCRVRRVTETSLPNLRTLDLSRNLILSVRMDVFLTLGNLKTLILSGNPLRSIIISERQSSDVKHHSNLKTLDLSYTSLAVFSSEGISCFPRLEDLNISFSQVDTVPQTGLSRTPDLLRVDLRGNPLRQYPQDLLKQLHKLRSILTDDFKLCCRQSLPDAFPADGGICLTSTTHAVSSCHDLLRYADHRAVFFAVMLVAVLGNLCCLVLKVCVRKNAASSPLDVLVTNLSLVDLLMGVYSTVVVVADWTYRGRYFSVKHAWTASFACQAASVAALTSYEASAFTVCLMSLHGLLTTLSHRRARHGLSKRAAVAACAGVWALALPLAAVPAFPGLSARWGIHGYSDNCVPLPAGPRAAQGRSYAFAVTVVLHLVVSSAACLGQVLLHWFKSSPRRDGGAGSLSITERSLRVAEATRATSVVLLDCARRFAFGLVGVAVHAGIHVPDEVNVFVTIFGFPANSAFNPLLYALGVVAERRRLVAERRLLMRLAQRMAPQKNS